VKLYEFGERVFQETNRGRKIAKLWIGESEEPTPAPIVEAGIQALREGKTKYTSAQGELALRQKLAQLNGVKPEQVFVTPGSKFAVFAALRSLCKPGDNVVTPAPSWPGYDAICGALGIELRTVRSTLEQRWRPEADAVEAAMDDRTRALIVCDPSNPTSTILEPSRMNDLAGRADRHGVPLLLDEAYRGLAFKEMGKPPRAGDGKVMRALSFSKGYAMTGWRCGFLLAHEEVIQSCVKFAQASISCVPQFVQAAALKALETPGIERKQARRFEERAKIAVEILRGTFDFVEPEAGFYLFAGRKGLDSDALCLRLLEKGIGVAPGTAFGYPEFLRISLTPEPVTLQESLRALVKEVKT
jgi:aspartate aminotransferase